MGRGGQGSAHWVMLGKGEDWSSVSRREGATGQREGQESGSQSPVSIPRKCGLYPENSGDLWMVLHRGVMTRPALDRHTQRTAPCSLSQMGSSPLAERSRRLSGPHGQEL